MDRIAIIGMSCLFPGAPTLADYWANIVSGVDAISEVPHARWDASFYEPDSRAVDRFYCRRGGFIDDIASFDPVTFGVMPKAADAAEPDQLLMLKIGLEALRDAGYQNREFARQRTGVVIGRGNYITAGGARLAQHVRVIPQVLLTLGELFPDLGASALAQVKERLLSQLDYFGPDVAAGMIPNLVASRLANKLDLRGPAFTVDAACASSLIALEHACTALRSGQTDMMMVGGVHVCHDLTFWATFCQLGALSRTGVIRPFSRQADGILAGEGIGMVVLKRLDDAVASGDRIYAVIEGVGSASDGRSGSLIAPSADGQFLALERAWAGLPFAPQAIGLLEAHGTGTPAGDEAELETVARFFGPTRGPAERAVMGSVKSMIGHTMPAAGIAGLIKGALAVHHGVLPPSLHCGEPHPGMDRTCFRVLGEARPWEAERTERIAGVNAFGFGGINAHVVIRGHAMPVMPTHRITSPVPGLPRVMALSADTPGQLLERLAAGQRNTDPGNGACRIAIVDPDSRKLELARKIITAGQPWHGRSDMYFTTGGLAAAGGKVALLFPGIDSSFAPQTEGLAAAFGHPVPEHIHQSHPSDGLLGTALGVLEFNRYLFGILQDLKIQPDAIAGHSIGEWSAMHASGMMIGEGLEDRIGASIAGNAIAFPDVLFLAAGCDVHRMQRAMHGLAEISVSHENCPHQAIACGRKSSIETLASRLRESAVFCEVLPFVSGFHSPLFNEHLGVYREFFGAVGLSTPRTPIWSATTATPYPDHPDAVRDLAIDHLLQPVRFHALIDAMYAAGCRVFIQAGTGSLVGFIGDILKGRPHVALHANQAKRSAVAQLTHMSAALWVEGLAFDAALLGIANALPGARDVPPAAVPERKGKLLALGVPLVQLGAGLDLGTVSTAGSARQLAEQAAHPVQRMVFHTIAEIERATREVSQLFAQHQSGVGSRHAGPTADASRTAQPARAAAAPVPPSGIQRRIRRVLDLDTTIPYVRDHALHPQREGWPIIADRYPVVPMTMEVMLVREAVEETLPGYVVVEVREIQAYRWLMVSTPCNVDIVVQSLGTHLLQVDIEGYFRAQVEIAAAYAAPAAPHAEEPLAGHRETAISAQALYQDNWMFHGPAYQGVERFLGIGSNGIDGDIRVPDGKGALLDNMGQLAGYWVMEQPDNCLAMPIGVGKIRFHGPDPLPGQRVTNQVRVRQLDADTCITDHVLRDVDGKASISIEGWATRRYRMDRSMWANSRQLPISRFSQPLTDGVMVFNDVHDTAIMRDHLACRYLSQPEVLVYEQLPPRRKRQWLSGRVAAKDAVRDFLASSQGVLRVFPKEIRIENDAAGAPRVVAHVTNTVPSHLRLSIAHKAGIAVALASDGAVGVDVEVIEPRPDSFVAMVCSEAEWRLLDGDDQDTAVTRAWVAKEAVAKSLEIGMGANLRSLVVEAVDGPRVKIGRHWVHTARVGQHIVGWTQEHDAVGTTIRAPVLRTQEGIAHQEKQGS